MVEVTTLPTDNPPIVGNHYNYGGDNYTVTRYEPEHFIVQTYGGDWENAVEFQDLVDAGETPTVLYVVGQTTFVDNYEPGNIPEDQPEVDNSLPVGDNDADEPEAKG
jgi:hypothetical protein